MNKHALIELIKLGKNKKLMKNVLLQSAALVSNN